MAIEDAIENAMAAALNGAYAAELIGRGRSRITRHRPEFATTQLTCVHAARCAIGGGDRGRVSSSALRRVLGHGSSMQCDFVRVFRVNGWATTGWCCALMTVRCTS